MVKKLGKPSVTETKQPKANGNTIGDVGFYFGKLTSEFRGQVSEYEGLRIEWKQNGIVKDWNMGIGKVRVLAELMASKEFKEAAAKFISKK